MVRLLKSVRADEIGPNTVMEIFGVYYRVRKLNYHGDRTTIFLQEEGEPLSYFNKNDIISVTVPCELKIDIEVKP
ncbi:MULTISPECIES: hypothetical protein [Enterobacter cloacae complex]|uniref:hypothetical protein n=1 Tax=Enterobacter cloacae complex TaxID=354276 RepID=UPI0007346DBC|nr:MULTISPECIES: hypothetical protein [Enterobacter cloacae complex]KTQ49410.1 hypothetical protein NS104_04870 [Enterobacter cancerogenus]KTQ51925.1 hypothetical protein NS111_12750 [Enterobacter cancerogenus]KTQ73399.1 hypothetical protein NS188_13320 [Enterobacter cancerogenus]KTQ79876.1 hypothetical protein NS31R_14365 [Enterobacter cancerogenus]VAG78080.1 Uncharacterised protein [Enterobacter hormaechei]